MKASVYDRLTSNPPEDCERPWVMARVFHHRLSPAWLLEAEMDLLDRGWAPPEQPPPEPAATDATFYPSPQPGPSFGMRYASPGPFRPLDRRQPKPAKAQPEPQPSTPSPALLAYRSRRRAAEERKAARAEAQRREQAAKRRHYMTHEPYREWMSL